MINIKLLIVGFISVCSFSNLVVAECVPLSSVFLSVTTDSEEIINEDGRAANAIDDNTTTIWHTEYSPAPPQPHWIEVDLSIDIQICGFSYIARQDGSSNGDILDAEVSVNGIVVWTGTFDGTKNLQVFNFSVITGQDVRLTSFSVIDGQPYTAAAEFKVWNWEGVVDANCGVVLTCDPCDQTYVNPGQLPVQGMPTPVVCWTDDPEIRHIKIGYSFDNITTEWVVIERRSALMCVDVDDPFDACTGPGIMPEEYASPNCLALQKYIDGLAGQAFEFYVQNCYDLDGDGDLECSNATMGPDFCWPLLCDVNIDRTCMTGNW